MTAELKTLAELWKEAGEKPFDAIDRNCHRYHICTVNEHGKAPGWDNRGDHVWWFSDQRTWRPAPPQPKTFKVSGYAWGTADVPAVLTRQRPNTPLTVAGQQVLGCRRFEVEVTEGQFDE